MPFTAEELKKLRQRLDSAPTRKAPSGSGNLSSADISDIRGRLDQQTRQENEQAAKDRSTISDILLGIPRGIVGAAELSQRAARATEGAVIPGEERGPVGRLVTKGIDAIKEYGEDAPWMTGKRFGVDTV